MGIFRRRPALPRPLYSGPPQWIMPLVGLAWMCFAFWMIWCLGEFADAVARIPAP